MSKLFKFDEELHEICPVCGRRFESRWGCKLKGRECKKGHKWQVCPKHGTTLIGSDRVGRFVEYDECICDSTAVYRVAGEKRLNWFQRLIKGI